MECPATFEWVSWSLRTGRPAGLPLIAAEEKVRTRLTVFAKHLHVKTDLKHARLYSTACAS